MNERIQKLYDQADKFAKENRTQTISGPGNNYFELFNEKFAELIVKKCMDVAKYHTPDTEECEYTWSNHDKIQEHFGVEE
jgi:hypothetical protein